MIRIDCTAIIKSLLKCPDTLEEDRLTHIRVARAAKLLAMADKYDHAKANHMERMANRFDSFYHIVRQEKIYLKDVLHIAILVVQELADDVTQAHQSITWDVEFIKHYIQANNHVFQNDDIIA
jgi:hypothetical protein